MTAALSRGMSDIFISGGVKMIISKKAMDQILRTNSLGFLTPEEFSYKSGECIADCFVEHAWFDYDVEKGVFGVYRFVTLYLKSLKNQIVDNMLINGVTDRLEELGIFDTKSTNEILKKIEEAFSS